MMRRLLALAVVLATTAGCATKRDLRDVRDEMNSMRVAQENLLREIQRQNAAILDSLSTQDVRLRGDLTNQLLQIDRQLVQIQELTGQGQQQLSQLREAVRQREEAFRSNEGTGEPGGAAGDPEELFTTSQAAMQRGSHSTARAGFEEFVRSFPQHPRAAEAQLAIGRVVGEGQRPGTGAAGLLAGAGAVPQLHPCAHGAVPRRDDRGRSQQPRRRAHHAQPDRGGVPAQPRGRGSDEGAAAAAAVNGSGGAGGSLAGASGIAPRRGNRRVPVAELCGRSRIPVSLSVRYVWLSGRASDRPAPRGGTSPRGAGIYVPVAGVLCTASAAGAANQSPTVMSAPSPSPVH